MLPVKYFMHFGIVDINYMYVDSVFPTELGRPKVSE